METKPTLPDGPVTETAAPPAPVVIAPMAVPERNGLEWLEPAGYPLAVWMGWHVSDSKVRTESYRNIAKQGYFAEAQKARHDEYQKLFKRVESKAGYYVDDIAGIEKNYRSAVKTAYEKLGLHNHFDYWKVLNRNQRYNVLIEMATVSGIVLGACIAMANTHAWMNGQKADEAEQQKAAATKAEILARERAQSSGAQYLSP